MKKIFFLFVLIIFFLLGKEALALTISPPLLEIEAGAGENLEKKITLFNETNQPLVIYSSLQGFWPDEKNGLPRILPPGEPRDAVSWLQLSAGKIELKSGEKKEINLKVGIPLLAEPGGYYVNLFWSDNPPQGEGVVTANRLATVILFKIKGEIEEDLKVVSFSRDEQRKNAMVFNLRLENAGNVHLRPFGQLKILNWKKEPVGLAPINYLKQVVLPKSQRNFQIIWPEGASAKGTHYAEGVIFYGTDNQELKIGQIKFWIESGNPWFTVAGVLAVLMLGAIIIHLARRKKQN